MALWLFVFSFDLTDKWNYAGRNVLVVRLENKPESSRWYAGSGLYRHVRLVTTNNVCIDHWGVFVTTPEVDAKKRKPVSKLYYGIIRVQRKALGWKIYCWMHRDRW